MHQSRIFRHWVLKMTTIISLVVSFFSVPHHIASDPFLKRSVAIFLNVWTTRSALKVVAANALKAVAAKTVL